MTLHNLAIQVEEQHSPADEGYCGYCGQKAPCLAWQLASLVLSEGEA